MNYPEANTFAERREFEQKINNGLSYSQTVMEGLNCTVLSFAQSQYDDKDQMTMWWDVIEDGKITETMTKCRLGRREQHSNYCIAAANLVMSRVPKSTTGPLWDADETTLNAIPQTPRIALGLDARSERMIKVTISPEHRVGPIFERLKDDESIYTIPFFMAKADELWWTPEKFGTKDDIVEIQKDLASKPSELKVGIIRREPDRADGVPVFKTVFDDITQPEQKKAFYKSKKKAV